MPATWCVTLQQLDPVYVDFYVPQKVLADLHNGQKVALTLDAFAGKVFPGTLNAISPKVDTDTRNVQVEAEVPNPDRMLTPGMFVNVSVDVGTEQRYLTLPQTAVVYNPYGETVYVVSDQAPISTSSRRPRPSRNNSGPDSRPAKPAPAKGPQLPADAPVAQQTVRDERSTPAATRWRSSAASPRASKW